MAAKRRKENRPPPAPRWPAVLMFLAGLLSLGGMIFARVTDGRNFLYGLIVVGAGVGLMACALAARAVGHRLWRPGTLGPFAAVLAAVGALIRIYLLSSVPKRADGPPQVLMVREILIGTPLAIATFALALGTYAVYRAVNLPAGGLRERAARIELGAGVVAMAGALYTLGPVLSSLGVPLNHWTFLGLVGLAVVAFVGVTVWERVFG